MLLGEDINELYKHFHTSAHRSVWAISSMEQIFKSSFYGQQCCNILHSFIQKYHPHILMVYSAQAMSWHRNNNSLHIFNKLFKFLCNRHIRHFHLHSLPIKVDDLCYHHIWPEQSLHHLICYCLWDVGYNSWDNFMKQRITGALYLTILHQLQNI